MSKKKVKCKVFKSEVNDLLLKLRNEIDNYLNDYCNPYCDSITGYRDFTGFTHLFWKLSYRIFVKESKKFIYKIYYGSEF